MGPNATQAPSGQSTILVVEDDRMVRRAICRVIQNEGYATVEAGSIPAAWKVLTEERPSLLVTDLNLSGSSGWTLIAQTRADPALSELPIIVLTGDLDGDPQSSKLDPLPGLVITLLKPFSPNQLLEVVRSFCGPPVAESGVRRTAAGIGDSSEAVHQAGTRRLHSRG